MANRVVRGSDLQGVIPPLPAPFDRNGRLHFAGLQQNFQRLNQVPLSGYLIQGSNGEFPFLSPEERVSLVNETKKLCPPDRFLMAGSGCESTQATIDMSNKMADNGADCVLVLNPFYYKGQMSSSVLLSHFQQVADHSRVPILLYNMPGNTGLNIPIEVVTAMAAHPNCIGIKDSGGDISRIALIANKTAQEDFSIMAGSGALLLPTFMAGGTGVIAALGNVLGQEMCELHQLCQIGDWSTAAHLQRRLVEPNSVLTAKFGVAGLKGTMDWIGMYGGYPRAPLQSIDPVDMNVIKKAFHSNGFYNLIA